MDKQFLLIWLADELKPRLTKEYILTSRGLAPFNGQTKNATSFLLSSQLEGKNATYDSSYTIYNVDAYNMLRQLKVEPLNRYNITNIGDLNSIENLGSFLEFFVYKNELYIFDFEGEIDGMLRYLISSLKIVNIYSKKKIVKECELIRFYFASTIESKDPIIQEAVKCGLIGDYKNNKQFKFGEFYNYMGNSNFPLLMWPRDQKVYTNCLVEVDYYEFIKYVPLIKEYANEDFCAELSEVSNNGGSFHVLYEKGSVVGLICLSKKANTYYYVEYLGIINEYRGKNISVKLLDSIKAIAQEENKNLILTIETSKLLKFYLEQGFKSIGLWQFD